jgi:type I restriction enzyme S subunit
MREGWSQVRVGDVAHLDVDRLPVTVGETYKIAGVLNAGQGLLEREPIDGSGTNYPALYRLRAGQLVMRKLTAWEGPITVVPPGFDGSFVSPEFPTFTLDQSLISPEYMRLVCQRPEFWGQMRDRSTGSVQRRKRVSPGQLAQIRFDLPPLSEQRRIVDLIGAVDTAIQESWNEHEAALGAANAVREHGLLGLKNRALSELLVSIEAGKSPAAEDRTPGPDDLAVLKVSAVRRGWFDESQVKVIDDAGGFPPHAALRNGDLLMTRANTKELVGLACRVEQAPRGRFLCDKTLRLNPRLELVIHDYLLEALLSEIVRVQIEDAASGTSGSMKNISQASIGGLQIPIMPRDRQIEWTATLAEARRVARLASQLHTQLRTLRAALVSDLVSGDHHIPSPYDDLIASA